MKGLIIKDIMCLKKQLRTFSFVLLGVFVLALMYVLSARFGNIAKAGADMLLDNDLTAVDVKNIGSFVLLIFMKQFMLGAYNIITYRTKIEL